MSRTAAIDNHRGMDGMATDSGAFKPLFLISDPSTNATVILDDVFKEMQYLEMQGEPLVALDLAADDNKHEPVATLSAQSIPLVPIAFDTQQKGEIETSNDASHNTLEDQIAKKRNRNREHASKTRLRKKFLLASLQEQIRHLQDQLERFKAETRIQAPQSAHAIIQKVCGNNDAVRHNPLAMPSRLGRMNAVAKSDSRLGSMLSSFQQTFVVLDGTLPEVSIVFCSQGFLDLTGYTRHQAIGRNIHFLQGPGTDKMAVQTLQRNMAKGVDTSTCLLSYRADGSVFWNQLYVAALRGAGEKVKFVAVMGEVSKAIVEARPDDTRAVEWPK